MHALNTERLRFEVTGDVAVMTFHRPERLNSLDTPLMDDIRRVYAHVNENTAIRALVTVGAGRAWCTGADLAAASTTMTPGLTPGKNLARLMEEYFNAVVRDLVSLRVPTVAALNGIVAGGGVGYALSHDLVIGARSADFRVNFTSKLAIVPDMGASWWLPRLIGPARAMGLAAFGDKLPAATAADWGLIWQCVDDGQLMPEAMARADRLARVSAGAFRKLREGLARAATHDLDNQLDWERDTQADLLERPDAQEGVLAFLQKRDPRFTGD